jgi:WD40 repeat protein
MNKITKRMLFIFVSLLVSAFLTACGASQTEAITFPIQNDIPLTQTSTSQPSQTATHVPIATPTPIITDTPIPQPTETPLPTLPKPADLLIPPPQFLVRLNRGGIGSIAVSPGGDWLAMTSINHICLYDTVSFKEAWCLHSDAIIPFISPVFSKNENYLAFKQGNGNIVILDWKTGERIQVIEGESEWNAKLTISPDGGQTAVNLEIGPDPSAGNYLSPSFWNTLTGQRIVSISDSRLFNEGWDDILWSPDGTRIVSCSTDGEYIIWNSENYEQLLEIKSLQITEKIGYLDAFESSCVWSPDSKFIYTHSEHRWLEKWDAATGQQAFSLDVNSSLSSLSVSPDGKWIALSGWGIVDTETGKIVKEINSFGTNLDWLDNNRLVFQSDRRSISIWDVNTDERKDILLPEYGFIEGLTWLPGNKITTISDDGSLQSWWAEDGQLVEEYTALLTPSGFSIMGTIVASPDSSFLAASSGGQVFILDMQTKQELFTLEPDDLSKSSDISDLCWSTNGKWLAGIIKGRGVSVWDIPKRRLILTIPEDQNTYIEALAWSPYDESRLVIGIHIDSPAPQNYEALAKIWDVENLREIQSLEIAQESNGVSYVAWLDANHVIVVHKSYGPCMVEVRDVEGYKVNSYSMDNVEGISPDGRIIVSISVEQLELLRWETGERYGIDNPGLAFWNLSTQFSPDLRFLAAQSGGSVTIWNISEFTGP